eukprot:156070_1
MMAPKIGALAYAYLFFFLLEFTLANLIYDDIQENVIASYNELNTYNDDNSEELADNIMSIYEDSMDDANNDAYDEENDYYNNVYDDSYDEENGYYNDEIYENDDSNMYESDEYENYNQYNEDDEYQLQDIYNDYDYDNVNDDNNEMTLDATDDDNRIRNRLIKGYLKLGKRR